MVWDLAAALSIPVVGIGGITTAQDALEFILAGAVAVQVGTANFRDPRCALDIMQGIQDFCDQCGCSISDLVGRARRQ
jgi:dihydroorotate dehydrogenase (NAD+) catalytic subunit